MDNGGVWAGIYILLIKHELIKHIGIINIYILLIILMCLTAHSDNALVIILEVLQKETTVLNVVKSSIIENGWIHLSRVESPSSSLSLTAIRWDLLEGKFFVWSMFCLPQAQIISLCVIARCEGR